MRLCNNCRDYATCCYRGIINPCSDYRPSSKHKHLRARAKTIVNMKMSFEEHRFVNSCTTLRYFTAKQESWLLSICDRMIVVTD